MQPRGKFKLHLYGKQVCHRAEILVGEVFFSCNMRSRLPRAGGAPGRRTRIGETWEGCVSKHSTHSFRFQLHDSGNSSHERNEKTANWPSAANDFHGHIILSDDVFDLRICRLRVVLQSDLLKHPGLLSCRRYACLGCPRMPGPHSQFWFPNLQLQRASFAAEAVGGSPFL